jgi:hypothetical protein
LGQFTKNYRTSSQKIVIKLSKIWVWDPRSGSATLHVCHNIVHKGKKSEKDKRMVRIIVFILPYLVGQPEDFEKEVQVLEAGNNILLSRVDEANHRVKTFQLEGNSII